MKPVLLLSVDLHPIQFPLTQQFFAPSYLVLADVNPSLHVLDQTVHRILDKTHILNPRSFSNKQRSIKS